MAGVILKCLPHESDNHGFDEYSHDVDSMTAREIKHIIWDNFARTVLF